MGNSGFQGNEGHKSLANMMDLVAFVDYLGWFSLMSTLEEIMVVNSGSTKVWVMDPSLFDV
jgi:hypothetical protein